MLNVAMGTKLSTEYFHVCETQGIRYTLVSQSTLSIALHKYQIKKILHLKKANQEKMVSIERAKSN